MSVPTVIDAAIIYVVTGSGQTPTRTVVCGIENVTINETSNQRDRFLRDCAKPGASPGRAVVVQSRQVDITGSGVTNADDIAARRALIGVHKNYSIDLIRRDGTDAGDLLGNFSGVGVMTASNLNLSSDNDGGAEVTIAGEGIWTYTPDSTPGASA